MTSREQLELLLSESISAARLREARAYDDIAGSADAGVVLFGAGGLGRRIARALRQRGIGPLAFVDNNRSLWGAEIEGIRVVSPESAAAQWSDSAVFVIAVWHPGPVDALASIYGQLLELGCQRIAPFPTLAWKYPDLMLPYYLWDLPSRLLAESDSIRDAFALLEDWRSQSEFIAAIQLRLFGDPTCLLAPCDHPQYFPSDLFKQAKQECFVDCGAYDGDSIRAFLDWNEDRTAKIIAFEPDASNFRLLRSNSERDARTAGRTRCVASALGSECAKLYFRQTGLADAAICPTGDAEVDCVTLDSALADDRPTFIKMDIEGAEIEALRGALRTIHRNRPVLAICVYHQQDHLWRIPLLLRQFLPDARLFLRSHSTGGFDLVCYSVPPERSVSCPHGEGRKDEQP